ncbi:MAG: pantetheine-phosphate adenylyltransferase [Succinivibrionaceae bacterium]
MIAVFPGTFDPFTNGHLDIVARGLTIFSKIVIAISENPSKKTILPVTIRRKLIEETFKDYQNIEVITFTGLLSDLLEDLNVYCILRGVRNTIDFEYELALQGMYKNLNPNIEVVLLPTKHELSFISSTFVRDVLNHGGDISRFVPTPINQYLSNKKL